MRQRYSMFVRILSPNQFYLITTLSYLPRYFLTFSIFSNGTHRGHNCVHASDRAFRQLRKIFSASFDLTLNLSPNLIQLVGCTSCGFAVYAGFFVLLVNEI